MNGRASKLIKQKAENAAKVSGTDKKEKYKEFKKKYKAIKRAT